jgi:hypothetical protein
VQESIFTARFNAFLGYKFVLHNLKRIKHDDYYVVVSHDTAFKMLAPSRYGYYVDLSTMYKNKLQHFYVIQKKNNVKLSFSFNML